MREEAGQSEREKAEVEREIMKETDVKSVGNEQESNYMWLQGVRASHHTCCSRALTGHT